MTSPDPFKLRILKAMTACLKEITPGGGYVTDLSDFAATDGPNMERVFRGRAWFGDNDPLPMVSMLEGVNPADDLVEEPVDKAVGEYDWPILVQGFVNDDPLHPTDPAYVLLADVRKRIAIEKMRRLPHDKTTLDVFGLGLGNKLRIQSIGSGVVRPADDVSSKAYFWMNVTLRIVENAAIPYA